MLAGLFLSLLSFGSEYVTLQIIEAHNEFLEIFEQEKGALLAVKAPEPPLSRSLTCMIRDGLANGSFWFFHALENPRGLLSLFFEHLMPRYASSTDPIVYDIILIGP